MQYAVTAGVSFVCICVSLSLMHQPGFPPQGECNEISMVTQSSPSKRPKQSMVMTLVLEEVTTMESTDFDPGYMGEHSPDVDLPGGHDFNKQNSILKSLHSTV